MDEKQIAKLIDELDSDNFRTRESSTKELRKLGRPMIPYLRDRLKSAGAEGVQRIRALMALLDRAPTAHELRCSRAVQVLELARTTEAMELLQEWSKGHATAWLTQQSFDSLKRSEPRK